MSIVAQKVALFKGDLYRYLNFDEIENFEDFGRVIPVEKILRANKLSSIRKLDQLKSEII